MARPIRNTDPCRYHLITIRTHQANLYLSPSGEVNDVIGGIIAKYQSKFKVVIYAYCVLSNHYHLLVMAPYGNIWRFEQAINREIAKRINRIIKREGHLWSRRYDDQIVMTEDDLLIALLYIINNPNNHGLVKHPSQWSGLNSYEQMLDEKPRTYKFINYTKYNQELSKGKNVSIDDFTEVYELTLSILPQLESMSKEERRAYLYELVEKKVKEIIEDRKQQGLGFMKAKDLKKQSPFSKPRKVKKSPRPLCYTRCQEAYRNFKTWFKQWFRAYKIASKEFRSGNLEAIFPEFTIKPPLLYLNPT